MHENYNERKIINFVKYSLGYLFVIRVFYLLEFLTYIIYNLGLYFFKPFIKKYALLEIINYYCNYMEICPSYSMYIIVIFNYLVFALSIISLIKQ